MCYFPLVIHVPSISVGELMESLVMPFAVTIAAWVTYRPDARLTWLMALPFFVLATMFTLNYDSIHLVCLLYTSPSPRDQRGSRMPSSA